MSQVRAEIDRIDREMVDLIAQRFGYVERAWQLKKDPSEAYVPWRIQQVIDKVKAHSSEKGMPAEMTDMVAALWRQMIGWFVQYEEEKLRRQAEGNAAGGKTS
jgi:isochorismate pyruvate lyase